MADIARRLGKPLMPWQRDVVDVVYELDPDTGRLWYQSAGITVPRQSGKTELVKAMTVHRLTRVAHKHGPQRSLYVTQKRHKARQKLEQDFAPTLRNSRAFREMAISRARPQRPVEWRLSLNNGNEHIQFGRASYWQIDAPSRDGGHGDSLDDGTVDEAWAQRDSTVEDGLKPAMAARTLVGIGPQWRWLSTAGDATSYWMWRKMAAGRQAVEDPTARVAYFEYSAADDADPGDPATWILCSPALGITIDIEYLHGLWDEAQREGPEAIDGFRRAYLNQWPEVPVLEELTQGSDMDVDQWLRLADPDASRGANVVFGVDIGTDRLAHIAVAWRRPDGRVQVMLADTGLSPLRTPSRLAELEQKWKGHVMLGGPAAALEADVRNATIVSNAEFAAAVGRTDDLITDAELRHGNQPELNVAVRDAHLRSFGAAGERSLQLRDAPTVAPLAAAVRAIHGLLSGAAAPAAAPMTASGTPTTARPSTSTADLSTLSF